MSRLVPFLQRFALTSWYWRLWIHAESAAERLLPFWWVPEDRAWWPRKKVIVLHQAAMPPAASEQAGAAKLATSLDIILTSGEGAYLWDAMGDDRDMLSEIRLQVGEGHSGYGLYVSSADYPEYGAMFVRHFATPSPASPAGEREALGWLLVDKSGRSVGWHSTFYSVEPLENGHAIRATADEFHPAHAPHRWAQVSALATQPLAEQEPSRPDILERLTYHQLEREDLSLDDCLSYLANGWSEIPGRTPRQMVLQILALLAGRHGPVVAGEVLDELARATAKFPTWPTDPLHAIAVLGEEFGELTKAMLQLTYEPHKSSRADVREEAIQTSAMALRLAMSLERYEYSRCYQHVQRGGVMAVLENAASSPEAVAAWKASMRTMSPADLMAQQLVQRGAEHALASLQQFGVTQENCAGMLASLRDGLFAIHEVANERGITLVSYQAPDDGEIQG